jgi:glycosyltransferase involved in cell wall biosynthesis
VHLAKAEFGPVKRPLRILVAQNLLHNRTGGMSRMLTFIHEQVERDGHTVEYFGAEQVPARFGGFWARFSFPLLLRRYVVTAARAGRPYDVLNVHEPSASAVACFRGPANWPRLIVTSHGLEQRSWEVSVEDARLGRVPLSWKGRLSYPLTCWWQSRLSLRHADHVFCLSNEDRDYLSQRLGVPSGRVTRIYPAADPAYGGVFGRRDYAVADRLLFFGTWLPRKGTPDLVAAFAALVARRPGLGLTVLGAGFSPEEVRVSFPEALRDRVDCPRPGTEAELAEHLLRAAVFILPSTFEGTPQTLMEAMLSGLPVVATATCGMRDVIRDGRNGLLIPIRSPQALTASIDRLLDDVVLRTRLGREAHADAAANYTWEKVALPVRAVYQDIASDAAHDSRRRHQSNGVVCRQAS